MEYTVLRKKRKTLGIKISETGEVFVYAPFNVSMRTIESIVKSRENWINESKKKIMQYENGDKIIFLGKEYNFNIIKTRDKKVNVEFEGSQFNVYFCGENSILICNKVREHLYKNYKYDFLKIVNERIFLLAAEVGVKPNKVNIRNQKTIWGSCSQDNNISINFKLALAPLEIVDYVILHELCHVIHKNHSKEFWITVQRYMPDYRKKRNWLKANGCKVLF